MVTTTYSEVTFGGVRLHHVRSGLGKVLLYCECRWCSGQVPRHTLHMTVVNAGFLLGGDSN